MIAEHFRRLAKSAGETGEKNVYTFVPGNLTELLLSLRPAAGAARDQRPAVGHARQVAATTSQLAEKLGHSEDVCTYVKCDLGMMKSGNIGPTGEPLPDPDLLLLSYTGCFTFMKWFEILREEYDCPVAMLHVPYQGDGAITDSMRDYVVEQLREEVIPALEKISGKQVRRGPAEGDAARSAQAEDDLVWVLESAKNVPSPIDAYFGGVYYIGPIFTAFRGTEDAPSTTTASCAPRSRSASSAGGPVTPDGEIGEERFRIVVEGPPNWTTSASSGRCSPTRARWSSPRPTPRSAASTTTASATTPTTAARDARRVLHGLLHQPQSAEPRRHARATSKDYDAGRPADQLDQELQLVQRRPADDPARGREAHRVAGGFIESDLVDPRYFSAANIKNRSSPTSR